MSTWLRALGPVLVLLGATLPAAAAPVRVGIIPINDTLPLYAAVDEGYFKAEGIDVELIALPSGTRIIEALAGGSLDVGLSATLSVLQAVEQGLDLVIVEPAAFARTDSRPINGLMVLKSSGTMSAAQLRGKVIGVNALKNIGYLMVAEFLARGGVRDDEVTWQEIPIPQTPAALEHRQVDAVNAVEPFVTLLQDSGKARVLAAGEAMLPGVSISVLTALRSWHAKNPALMAGFDRAYKRGVEFCNQHPERARELLVRHTKTPPELAHRMGLNVFRPAIVPADVAVLQAAAQRHGILGPGVDLNRILTRGAAAK